MEDRGLLPHCIGHTLDGLLVGRIDRVTEDQAQVDVAHQGAEAAVGKAAQCVGRDKPFPEGVAVRGHRLGKHCLTFLDPHLPLGHDWQNRRFCLFSRPDRPLQ